MPIGLSLGSQTPEEIAISILAELVGARRQAATPGKPGS
jgi:xanthine/CO dehydrogenase XdhC/CoxF family maturation factor